MNYAIILAGGSGTRMGKTEMPKQFLKINDKPIIIYTIEKIINNPDINRVIISCNKDYIDYTKQILDEYNIKEVYVTEGGKTRFWSVMNGINFIEDKWGIKNDDIFLAHDSVRPFVTNRILSENIREAKKNGAATTVVDLIETISEVNENNKIFKLYPRTNFYSGQSPQTFNIKKFVSYTHTIPKDILNEITDLAVVFVNNNDVVTPVIGDRENIKITTPIDLVIAKNLMDRE